MNKKIVAIYMLVIFFLFSYTSIVFAGEPFLSNFQLGVGRSEKERHAGMNLIFDLHGIKPDGTPTDEAIGLDLGPDYGYFTTKQAWINVKTCVLNAGKIKDLSYYISKADYVINENPDGSLWIDCSQFKAGTYYAAASCTHQGGVTTYQILIFAIKLPFDITDQMARTFGIQDQNMILSPINNETLSFSSGVLRADGADVNRNHVPRIQADWQNNPHPIKSTVKIYTYDDIFKTTPSYGARIAFYTGCLNRDTGKIETTGRYPSVKGEYFTFNGCYIDAKIDSEYIRIVAPISEKWQFKLSQGQTPPSNEWWKLENEQELEINMIKNNERCK